MRIQAKSEYHAAKPQTAFDGQGKKEKDSRVF